VPGGMGGWERRHFLDSRFLVTQVPKPTMVTVSHAVAASAPVWDVASASRVGKSESAFDQLCQDVAEERPDNMADIVTGRLRERRGDSAAPRTQARDHGPIAERLAGEFRPQGASMTTAERLVSTAYTNAEKVPAGKHAASDAEVFHRPNKWFGVDKGDERADAAEERR